MPRPRVVSFVVSAVAVVAVDGAEMRQDRAARRPSADDEKLESMI